jgi:hypothetical protein
MTVFSLPGYLLFQRQGTLFAQAFDETDLKLQGEPIRVRRTWHSLREMVRQRSRRLGTVC